MSTASDPLARRLNLAYADVAQAPTFTDFPFRRKGGNIVITDREAERLSELLETIARSAHAARAPKTEAPGQLQFDFND